MKTNEEIRADLLSKYGWEINDKNELFPFVKLLYLKTENINDKVEELKNKINEVNKAVNKTNIKQVHFDNSMEAFWYGFGKFGMAIVMLALCATLIFLVTVYERKVSPHNEVKSTIEKKLT